MNECNVCYTNSHNLVDCFGFCTFKVCLPCFNALLKINACRDIEYACPMCRITSVKNKDRRFTIFVNRNKSTLKKIVSLYETNHLNNAWHIWTNSHDISYSVFDNQIFRLTPEQLAELTYIGHSHDYVDEDDNLPD
jgi:hypothetical protein